MSLLGHPLHPVSLPLPRLALWGEHASDPTFLSKMPFCPLLLLPHLLCSHTAQKLCLGPSFYHSSLPSLSATLPLLVAASGALRGATWLHAAGNRGIVSSICVLATLHHTASGAPLPPISRGLRVLPALLRPLRFTALWTTPAAPQRVFPAAKSWSRAPAAPGLPLRLSFSPTPPSLQGSNLSRAV